MYEISYSPEFLTSTLIYYFASVDINTTEELWNRNFERNSMYRGLFVHVWMYLGLDKNWWRWGGLLGVAWLIRVSPESVEWFIEDQAFLPSFDLTPLPPYPVCNLSLFLTLLGVVARAYWRERGRGWERSQIIRRRESLVLYTSLNTLWVSLR